MLKQNAEPVPGTRGPRIERRNSEDAFSLVEVLIAVMLLGIMVVSLFGAFSTGMAAVQSSRENLRATQIMMQKTETIRLMTWSQGTNYQIATPKFRDWYDPTGGTNSRGAVYQGFVNVEPAPADVPAAYRDNMRLVTVTIYWTNHIGVRSGGIPQTRQMQTLVSRYGMQNYVF